MECFSDMRAFADFRLAPIGFYVKFQVYFLISLLFMADCDRLILYLL